MVLQRSLTTYLAERSGRPSGGSGVDRELAVAINSYVGQSQFFDAVVAYLSNAHFIKMGPLLALVVALWFWHTSNPQRQAQILSGLAGVIVALAGAIVLQRTLPMSERPLHAIPELVLPPGLERSTLRGESSFPSDTTTLSIAVATVIFLQNRTLGALAFLWAIFVVIFPRVYLGLHYVSDVAGGAVLAVLSVCLTTALLGSRMSVVADAMRSSPHVAAPLAFLILFLTGTMFNDVRALISLLVAHVL